MRTQLEYNVCSLPGCRGCGEWSVTVSMFDGEGSHVDGYRLLGSAKWSREVRVLTPDEPLYRRAYEALLKEKRAADIVPHVTKPDGWT